MKYRYYGLNEFARGYVTAALWTFDENPPTGDYEQSGRAEELFNEIADSALDKMLDDCLKFQNEQAGHLRIADQKDSFDGHNFWLTRNHHGAGFGDGEYPKTQGEELTKASHAFGECNLYRGDDGKIYCS